MGTRPSNILLNRLSAGALACILASASLACSDRSNALLDGPRIEVSEAGHAGSINYLFGTMVLEIDSFPVDYELTKHGITSRWELPVEITEILYIAPDVAARTSGDVAAAPGTDVLVSFNTSLSTDHEQEPPWDSNGLALEDVDHPIYVVAGRSTGNVGAMREGDLVVKGMFADDLTVIGDEQASDELQSFFEFLVADGYELGSTKEFLIQWVRSLNEEYDMETGSHPLAERWLVHTDGEVDTELDLIPETASPEIATRLEALRLSLDATGLDTQNGALSIRSNRGQLAAVPNEELIGTSPVWLLPDEELELQLLFDDGVRSVPLETIDSKMLLEHAPFATVRVSGTIQEPDIAIDGDRSPLKPAEPTTTQPG